MSRLQFERLDSDNSFEELNTNDKKLINLRGGYLPYRPPEPRCILIPKEAFTPDLKPGHPYCPGP